MSTAPPKADEPRPESPTSPPDPKWVVAVGGCAVDGGIFAGSYAVAGGVNDVIPVDLHIRGCPPSPIELLKGLIALLDVASGKAGKR